jgi:5-methylcytosine-specific restriction endonuclease McrA
MKHLFQKGHIFYKRKKPEWNKGKKIDRKKYPNFGHFKKHSEKSKQKNRVAHLKENLSDETRKKMSEAQKKRKHTENTKRKMSLAHGGNGTPQRSSKRYYHILDKKYKEWRSKVFARDNWTCQTCSGKSEIGKPIYIEPHHIKGWAKYPKLRYELSNGVTLCKECHKLTHKKH